MPSSFGNYSYSADPGIWIPQDPREEFKYSDGEDIENNILEKLKEANDLSIGSGEIFNIIQSWPTFYHLSPKRADLLRPLADKLKNKKVLEIGSGCGALTRFLGELGCSVVALEGSLKRASITKTRCRDLEHVVCVCDNFSDFQYNERFDFVILAGVLAYSNAYLGQFDNPPLYLLQKAKSFLKDSGSLIIAIENKLGLKYWAGAPEDYTGIPYFGIENRYSGASPVTFGKKEITDLLHQSGFDNNEFLYPYPDYKLPDIILTEKCKDADHVNTGDLLLEKQEYFQDRFYLGNFSTSLAGDVLIQNSLLNDFSNSFLIIASGTYQEKLAEKIFAFSYSTLRTRKYCKSNILYAGDNNAIRIKRNRLYEYKAAPGSSLDHQIHDEDYHYGNVLLKDLVQIVSKKGWSVQELITWAELYYQILKTYAHEESNKLFVPGNCLDLTPFNIIINEKKDVFVFDLEWVSKDVLPVYYVFFRGLIHSIGRIFFFEDPSPGTPHHVKELAVAITKSFFDFDQSTLQECEALEHKYFAQVAPFAYTAFGYGEIKIRGSEIINLKKDVEQTRLTLEQYRAELDNQSRQLAALAEKISADESVIRDLTQRETETRKELALANENFSKKSEEYGLKMRLLTEESQKKESQFLKEISELRNSNKWYRDTYQERSLPGLIKQKLFDSIGRGSSKMTGLSKKPHKLIPGNDLVYDQVTGVFSVSGPDPFFWISRKQFSMPAGWYLLSVDITVVAGILHLPKIYFDCGRGYNEEDVWFLPQPVGNKIESLIKFPTSINGFRFDPSVNNCRFRAEYLSIKKISKTAATLRAFKNYNKDLPDRSYWDLFRELAAALFSGGITALKKKIRSFTEINRLHKISQYMLWYAEYDTLTAQDIQTLKTKNDELPVKPFFSVIMPVYNPPIVYLRKAIESVINQTYPFWELCIADDCSTDKMVKEVLKEYTEKYNSIKVVYRQQNGHISEASNSALDLATGDFIVLLDNDDELSAHALYVAAETINSYPEAALIYSDEDKIDEDGVRFDPYFKSDWNPDLFFGQNMISHLGIYRADIVHAIKGFRKGYEGSQDYDLALRFIAMIRPDQIVHIPHVLYHWRAVSGSTAVATGNKNYAYQAGMRALESYFQAKGQPVQVIKNINHSYRVKWSIGRPCKASIIIPSKDKPEVLAVCLNSVLDKTEYSDYEIIIVDNNSLSEATIRLYESMMAKDSRIKLVKYQKEFNFSAMINLGAEVATGEVLVLLNNDTEVIAGSWLEELVSHAIRPEVGAVGAKLLYPNGQIQHAGVVLYENHPGIHIYSKKNRDDPGYFNRLNLAQDYNAVTAACLAVERKLFRQVGGFDEGNLRVAYNDVDFCLRLRENGYNNVWTPFALLYHHESLSRGDDFDETNIARFRKEHSHMLKKWDKFIRNDPYFNPNLSIETSSLLARPPRAVYSWRKRN